MKFMPVRSEIAVGDAVISSGLGGIFPKGLLVGYVERLGEESQELFREVILKPGVGFPNLEEVFVLKQNPEQGHHSLSASQMCPCSDHKFSVCKREKKATGQSPVKNKLWTLFLRR